MIQLRLALNLQHTYLSFLTDSLITMNAGICCKVRVNVTTPSCPWERMAKLDFERWVGPEHVEASQVSVENANYILSATRS